MKVKRMFWLVIPVKGYREIFLTSISIRGNEGVRATGDQKRERDAV